MQNTGAKIQDTLEALPGVTPLRNGGLGVRRQINCIIRQPPPEGGSIDEPILDFIASDQSIDRYNEVIELGGWQLDNYKKNPVVMDSHDYSSVARILGKSLEVAVRGDQLVNRVRFATDNPLGALAYKLALGGFIRSESVGFIPIEWVRGNESAGEPYRTYKKQELIEISLVSVPANPSATIPLAIKTGVINKAEVTELTAFLKYLCNDLAESFPDSRARGIGFDGAHLLLQQIRAALHRP
jgi:HK97 family phage prohead protease